MNEEQIMQALGRLEGGLESLLDRFIKHTEREEKLDAEMRADISAIKDQVNQAKGARTIITWIIGLGAGGYAIVHGWFSK